MYLEGESAHPQSTWQVDVDRIEKKKLNWEHNSLRFYYAIIIITCASCQIGFMYLCTFSIPHTFTQHECQQNAYEHLIYEIAEKFDLKCNIIVTLGHSLRVCVAHSLILSSTLVSRMD